MKVCFVSTSYPRYPADGYARFVHEQVKSLLALGQNYQVVVVTPHAPGLKKKEDIEGVSVVRFGYFWPRRYQELAYQHEGLYATIRRSKLAVIQLPLFFLSMFVTALIQSRDADLIHAQWLPTANIAGPIAWWRKIPLYVTARGADVNTSNSRLAKVALIAATHAKAVFAVSDGFTQVLKQAHPGLMVTSLYNGVDSSFYASAAGTSSSVDADTPDNTNKAHSRLSQTHKGKKLSILCVGGLIKRKRIDTILDALTHIDATPFQLLLSIIGEGPEESRLIEKTQSLGLSDIVNFTGKLEREAMAQRMIDADILILASESEGRPNVVLEAFASESVVVASDIPGTAELVLHQETGELFDVGDEHMLAESLNRVLHREEYRIELTKNALQYLADNDLNWSAHGRKLHDTYLRDKRYA